MDIAVPNLDYRAVEIAPERPATRSLGRPPASLTDVVSLGMPVVQSLNIALAGDDAPLAEFLRENDSRWRFHLVHLGCSFRPASGMEVAKARLAVEFGVNGDAQRPMVWSLSPRRLQRSITRSRSLKIGASVGLAETAVEMGVDGEASEVFLEAFGLHETACAWDFTRTATDTVSGTHRLAVVTRSDRDLDSSGRIAVSATITYRRFRLLRFSSELTDQEPMSFQLVPS